eukprot:GEMP01045812.1.p1 GENE.GEMP01045812.1~~GEMP01045812.1.p1  ORF type:complete len:201 (-),score=25.35 GEMP01045812.1:422-1024(-)
MSAYMRNSMSARNSTKSGNSKNARHSRTPRISKSSREFQEPQEGEELEEPEKTGGTPGAREFEEVRLEELQDLEGAPGTRRSHGSIVVLEVIYELIQRDAPFARYQYTFPTRGLPARLFEPQPSCPHYLSNGGLNANQSTFNIDTFSHLLRRIKSLNFARARLQQSVAITSLAPTFAAAIDGRPAPQPSSTTRFPRTFSG